MTFSIDTGSLDQAPATKKQYDGRVTFRGFAERADRKMRQIIAAIQCCETPQEVQDTLIEEDLILDAMLLDYPYMWEAVKEAAEEHTIFLEAGAASFENAVADAPIPAPANVLNKTF